MKANEFVKRYGWDEAKRVLVDCENQHRGLAVGGCIVNINNLKRLVENHKLVEMHGGLHSAINTLKLLESSLQIGLDHGLQVDAVTEIPKLKQAIADVESCQ